MASKEHESLFSPAINPIVGTEWIECKMTAEIVAFGLSPSRVLQSMSMLYLHRASQEFSGSYDLFVLLVVKEPAKANSA